MKNDKQPREPMEFKTTYLSKVGIRTLAEHALALPATNPARTTITGIVHRWVHDGQHVEWTDDGAMVTPLSREEAIGILASGSGADVFQALAERFDVSDEEIDAATVEAVMEEAA